MTKFNFDRTIEELTPFFLEQGFKIDKSLLKENNSRGFVKQYPDNPHDFCFCRFASYAYRTKVAMEYGVKLNRMTKYVRLLGEYRGGADDTLYQRGKVLSHFVDNEDLSKHALVSYKTAYFNWCIPFFEQNATPRGVFESVRFSGMDLRWRKCYYTLRQRLLLV